MRRSLGFLFLASSLVACSALRKPFRDNTPAHREPGTTSIYGTWVLREPDSTAFAGANLVEMELTPATFTITATYPTGAPVVVRGTTALTGTGLVVFTPTEGMTSESARWRISLAPGVPVTLLASAAGSTLVFAPAASSEIRGDNVATSSVWHRKEVAQQAGIVETPKKSP